MDGVQVFQIVFWFICLDVDKERTTEYSVYLFLRFYVCESVLAPVNHMQLFSFFALASDWLWQTDTSDQYYQIFQLKMSQVWSLREQELNMGTYYK